MSNPVVTRLGKTQIWYKNWYTNSQYTKTLKIVYSFQKLITNYFKYGIFYQNNFFRHFFWYKNTSSKKNQNTPTPGVKNNLYFRKYYFSHQTLSIEHSYFIRLLTPEYFPLKVYTLKYNSWIIISVQWFKPSKKHTKSNSFFLKKKHSIVMNSNKKTFIKTKPSRFILLLLTLKKNFPLNVYGRNLNYTF